MRIDVQVAGLKDFSDRLAKFPRATRRAAVMSINTTTRNARVDASREIRKQVMLTGTYLNSDKRLWISSKATETNLTATISARRRPTSLVTYGAKQLTRKGKYKPVVNAGVAVKVARGGRRKKIRQAFFARLRNGNVGVAVRSLEGLNLKKLNVSKKSAGIYTLYGPSVDQVFSTVRNDISPKWSKFLLKEFDRNYARLL